MEKSRLDNQLAFVKKHGWEQADLFPLPADASKRSYIRLVKPQASCLLMDAPPASEKLGEFIEISRHLQMLGFRSPQVYAADVEAGLALIEDFGDDTFSRVLARGVSEEMLYLKAADVLVQMHKAGAKAVAGNLPEYSMDILLEEVGRFLLWFVPAARGVEASAAETNAFTKAWCAALESVASDHSSFVFRDFHVDNLMLLTDESAILSGAEVCDKSASFECGLLDFQDALKGPPAYDMASLLEDARRDIAPATRASVLEHYFSGCETADRSALLRDMTVLAAQRHTKVVGIFVRLCVSEGNPAYLHHLPRIIALLKTALADPCLREVQNSMEAILPGFTEPDFVKSLVKNLS